VAGGGSKVREKEREFRYGRRGKGKKGSVVTRKGKESATDGLRSAKRKTALRGLEGAGGWGKGKRVSGGEGEHYLRRIQEAPEAKGRKPHRQL